MLVSSFAQALPKVQLHCHLEGTLDPRTFRTPAADRLADLPPFTTFREFLLLFAAICKTLREPADYGRLAWGYAEDAGAQGVRYAEIFVSPSVWTWFHPHLDVVASFQAIRSALDAAERTGGPHVALIVDLTRNFGAERARATVRLAREMQRFEVVAIGLGGDEANFAPELFTEAFAEGRAAGLHAVAHAGEAAGPASVRAAIDVLGAERIGHGVRAIEDDSLVRELAARGLPLEVCPTSNRLTGAVPAGRPHPLAAFLRAGVRCVIDADDPPLFGTTLTREYALVEADLGREAIVACARTAIEVAFASDERKAVLRSELEEFLARSEAAGTTP